MTKKMKKILGLALAALLVVGVGTAGISSVLKADEEQPDAPVVEQQVDVAAEAPAVEAPAEPALVVEEVVIERPAEESEEAAPEESAEAEPAENPEEAPEEIPAETPEEISEENPEEALEEEEETPKTVKVWMERPEVLQAGESMTLRSELVGFEDVTVAYRWQCDKGDGAGFQDVPGADASDYTFPISAETLTWQWRLMVDY